MSNKIMAVLLICVLASCLLFLTALTDYAWHYSGWTTLVKLGSTMLLVMWLIMIAAIVSDWRDDIKSRKEKIESDKRFQIIMDHQDYIAANIGRSLRKKE